MNNQQFRRLLFDNAGDGKSDGSGAKAQASAAPSSLGTKKSGFMPMTPRVVKGDVDFARQVRERNAALQPSKKFKSAAPKGVKLGAGYTDRAKARVEGDDAADGNDKASRVKALEEQMKLGQISQQTFEALRDEIIGGDIESTHLVKGLDRRLLERVRRGEDVLGTRADTSNGDTPLDAEEELDRLAEKEVEAVKKVTALKHGTKASSVIAGNKRTRDEIMAELKAQRKAAAESRASKFSDGRWKKVDEAAKNRIEIDHKGRKVLIMVDEDGVIKKKIRKIAPKSDEKEQAELHQHDARPMLGSDVLVADVRKPDNVADEEEDDDDIFEGVGAEYNPLAGEDDEEDSSDGGDDDDDDSDQPTSKSTQKAEHDKDQSSGDELETDNPPAAPRNYFKTTRPGTEEDHAPKPNHLAAVQQLIKKAAKIESTAEANAADSDDDDDEMRNDKAARLKKRAQMLAQHDRDFDDMDMGFGSSRYDDGEDEADGKVKLSEWKGDNHAESAEKGGGDKKKRNAKKRKGDANNMADIMRVIDGRKAGAGKK